MLLAAGEVCDGSLCADPAPELYDPSTGSFAALSTTNGNFGGLVGEASVLLSNGKIFLAGGDEGLGFDVAEVYDPATGTTTIPQMPAANGSLEEDVARYYPSAMVMTFHRIGVEMFGVPSGRVSGYGSYSSYVSGCISNRDFPNPLATSQRSLGSVFPIRCNFISGSLVFLAEGASRVVASKSCSGLPARSQPGVPVDSATVQCVSEDMLTRVPDQFP